MLEKQEELINFVAVVKITESLVLAIIAYVTFKRRPLFRAMGSKL